MANFSPEQRKLLLRILDFGYAPGSCEQIDKFKYSGTDAAECFGGYISVRRKLDH